MFFKKYVNRAILSIYRMWKWHVAVSKGLKSFQLAIRNPSYDLGGPKKLPWEPCKGTMGAQAKAEVIFPWEATYSSTRIPIQILARIHSRIPARIHTQIRSLDELIAPPNPRCPGGGPASGRLGPNLLLIK